ICPAMGIGGAGINYLVPASGVRNVFQGRLLDPNTILWKGVPIDAPASGTHVLRFVNVRANANQAASSSPGGAQIFSLLTVNRTDGSPVAIVNAQQSLAAVQKGLVAEVRGAATLPQCASQTPSQATFQIRLTEGFPSAFKARNTASGFSNPSLPPNNGLN